MILSSTIFFFKFCPKCKLQCQPCVIWRSTQHALTCPIFLTLFSLNPNGPCTVGSFCMVTVYYDSLCCVVEYSATWWQMRSIRIVSESFSPSNQAFSVSSDWHFTVGDKWQCYPCLLQYISLSPSSSLYAFVFPLLMSCQFVLACFLGSYAAYTTEPLVKLVCLLNNLTTEYSPLCDLSSQHILDKMLMFYGRSSFSPVPHLVNLACNLNSLSVWVFAKPQESILARARWLPPSCTAVSCGPITKQQCVRGQDVRLWRKLFSVDTLLDSKTNVVIQDAF